MCLQKVGEKEALCAVTPRDARESCLKRDSEFLTESFCLIVKSVLVDGTIVMQKRDTTKDEKEEIGTVFVVDWSGVDSFHCVWFTN